MTATSCDRRGLVRSILAALIAASLSGSASGADGPKPKAGKKAAVKLVADLAKAEGPAAKGKQAIEAVRELQAALDEAEKPGAKPSPASLDGRPKKVVTAPTLTPAALDALLDKSLAASKTPVSPLTTDEEFVRRVYLDVTGKLPTIEQMRAFVHAREKDKRARLVDALLKSDAYATNWSRYWRDVVAYRAPNEAIQQINYPKFEDWLADEFRANRPWDEVVTAIITAKGPNTENGATAFALAQMSQPVEMAGEVSRIFLGVQIQCAQCHDHPNDPWKREQFHEFAAFFAGYGQKQIQKREVGVPPIFGIVANGRGLNYTMPDLKDPTKQHPVNPKFFLGEKSKSHVGLKPEQRREWAASYITGQDNPWFARAFVNRVWGALMGEGFYTPIDDLGPTKESHNPEVLDALAAEWQKGGYDVRWLFRTILNTKAYQRESRSTNSAAGRTAFASNCPSRLRADQIFDSLAQALGLPVETFARPNPNAIAKAQRAAAAAKVTTVAAKEVKPAVAAKEAKPAVPPRQAQNSPRGRFNKTFGVDPSTPSDDVLGTITQALFLMNSPAVNNGLKATNVSMLGDLLRATPDNQAVLESLYLRVLARRPNAKEVHVCGRYIENVGNRVEAFEDILWGLINSTEFISRR